jgi:hypothetical protein
MKAQSFVVCVAGGLLAPTLALGDVLDFEAGDVGSVPTGWIVAMTSDGGPPRWEVVRDATSPAGEKVLAQISDDRTSGRFPLVPAQSWSALAVTFSGTRFAVAFDGAPLFEVEDSTFAAAGKVGLWTKADSVTYFDGFEATAR